MSTARAGSVPMFAHLLREMPAGPVLNVGSGATGTGEARPRLVHVDHALPQRMLPAGTFVVADAHDLPFSTESFSGAIAKDVLEHVDDPIAVLTELGRVCRPGSRLVVIVPRAIPRAVWDDPTHIRGFTKRALITALALSGWRLSAAVRRLGGLPGAGRFGLTAHLETLMRIPGVGHWFGRNWIARATLDPASSLR